MPARAFAFQRRLPSFSLRCSPPSPTTSLHEARTSTATIYAFSATGQAQLWKTKARAGINSFPAIAGRTLLVGAAAPGFFEHPRFELIAYSLG